MVRKILSVSLYILAGFFFYMGNILAFVSGVPSGTKWAFVAVVLVVAVLALVAGLASGHFRDWRRYAGVVLVGASGFTILLVFTFACLVLSEDLRKVMRPDTVAFFGDYLAGAAVVTCAAVAGMLLLRASRGSPERARSSGNAPSGAGDP